MKETGLLLILKQIRINVLNAIAIPLLIFVIKQQIKFLQTQKADVFVMILPIKTLVLIINYFLDKKY